MPEIKSSSDKGKEIVTSTAKKFDLIKRESNEKLTLRRENEHLLGGMDKGEPSSKRQKTTEQQPTRRQTTEQQPTRRQTTEQQTTEQQTRYHPRTQQQINQQLAAQVSDEEVNKFSALLALMKSQRDSNTRQNTTWQFTTEDFNKTQDSEPDKPPEN